MTDQVTKCECALIVAMACLCSAIAGQIPSVPGEPACIEDAPVHRHRTTLMVTNLTSPYDLRRCNAKQNSGRSHEILAPG